MGRSSRTPSRPPRAAAPVDRWFSADCTTTPTVSMGISIDYHKFASRGKNVHSLPVLLTRGRLPHGADRQVPRRAGARSIRFETYLRGNARNAPQMADAVQRISSAPRTTSARFFSTSPPPIPTAAAGTATRTSKLKHKPTCSATSRTSVRTDGSRGSLLRSGGSDRPEVSPRHPDLPRRDRPVLPVDLAHRPGARSVGRDAEGPAGKIRRHADRVHLRPRHGISRRQDDRLRRRV